MTFVRPTLAQLIERAETEIETRLGLGPLAPKSALRSIARVWAQGFHGEHGHLAWLARQLIPTTADSDELEAWASLWDIFRSQATQAAGDVTFTGTGTPTIPSGTQVQRADGERYQTTSSTAISGGEAVAPALAVTAGADANGDAGTLVSLVSPIAGVDDEATAEDGFAGGTNRQTDAELRAQLLARTRDVPQGGSEADYINWTFATPGVTVRQAYAIESHLGLGTVGVTLRKASGVPNAGDVALVQAYIDERRPVTADVTVFVPAAQVYTVDFASLTPNDVDTQVALFFAVSDFVSANGGPGQTLLLTQLQEAIATAPGVEDYELDSPVADVVVGGGNLATLTFVPA